MAWRGFPGTLCSRVALEEGLEEAQGLLTTFAPCPRLVATAACQGLRIGTKEPGGTPTHCTRS